MQLTRHPASLIALAATLAAMCALNWGLGWPWSGSYLLAINAATFALFAWDKRAARAHRWRVPESHLLVAAGLGGSPAAVVARLALRHKSSKRSFSVAFWVLLAAQWIALVGAAARGRL
jgi:uncharacterized membrane protein YsdA (DUF1294 family)